MAKYCFSFNDLALYRESIYQIMDNEFDADWYIEDVDTNCKEFERDKLKHVYSLHTIRTGPFDWVRGQLSLLWKEYDKFLFLGQSNNLSLYLFVFLKNLFYKKKKLYLWTHGWYGKETKLEVLLKKWLFSHSDGNFIYGDYAINLMKHHGVPSDKLWPIHNSLNYEQQLSVRKSIKTSSVYHDHYGNDNPVLIMIGRLTTRKHLDMLIKAVALLKAKGELYNVVIIGDGDCRKDLETLSNQLEVNELIWFYGACYDELKNAELLFNSDMCVVPGDIGLTAIHSMMFGVPCLTHNMFCYQGPEFEAIKEGMTGSFFDHMDINSLAFTISKWFTNNRKRREEVRKLCYNEIDRNWTPQYQISMLKKHML